AVRRVPAVSGLDPTAFPAVVAREREVLGFARGILRGDDDVVGTVAGGGTESCLLAVKTARDVWRAAHPDATGIRPRLLAPVTAHAAFQKAAHYFDLALDLVPVGPDGTCPASALVERPGEDVALVAVSAPRHPFAAL